jgi:hypothetical protein
MKILPASYIPIPFGSLRLILIAISIVAGLYTFFAAKYSPATLVLFTKTYEKGIGRVIVESYGESQSKSFSFEIGSDDGAPSLYPIELPANRISKIQILPMASSGKYQIDKISLQYDMIDYRWDDQGVCQQKSLRNNLMQREPCSAEGPVLTIAADSSVVISSIPAEGMERAISLRVFIAIISVLLSFAGLMWLSRPVATAGRAEHLMQYGVRLLWMMIAALFIFQYIQIWKCTVDVPLSEEWQYFRPDALPKGLTWNWLVGFYGLHRVVFTKLLVWINFKLFGLNFAWQNIQNYLLYGSLTVLLHRFKRAVIGSKGFLFFPAFLLFLFSSVSYENLLWPYQSQIHFVLLFFLLAITYAFPDHHGKRKPILFVVFAVCAIYSFTAGIVVGTTCMVGMTIHTLMANSERNLSSKDWVTLLCLWLLFGLILFAWFNGYRNPSQLIFIDDRRFWDFFVTLVALGFGFKEYQTVAGLICLVSCISPLVFLLVKTETRQHRATWLVITASSAIMLTLASISTGRAVIPGMASFSRYAELGYMLIPITAIAWWLAVKDIKRRNFVLVLFWGICFVGYADEWTTSPYRDLKQLNMMILECVEDYMNGTGDGNCPGNPSLTGSQDLDSAIRLDASFTRPYRKGR